MKKLFVLALCLLLCQSLTIVDICSAGQLFLPGMDMHSGSAAYKTGHPNHHDASCHNNSPCQTNYHCCNLYMQSIPFNVIGLDSRPLLSIEAVFHLVEVAKFLFHPPRPTT